MRQVLNFIVGLLINLKGRWLDSGSNFRRPIIGSNFGANIGPQLSFEPRSIIGPALSIANIASLGRSGPIIGPIMLSYMGMHHASREQNDIRIETQNQQSCGSGHTRMNNLP